MKSIPISPLFSALLGVAAISAPSQSIDLAGRVLDEGNRPMAGVTLTLVKAGVQAMTDAQGVFRITNKPASATPSENFAPLVEVVQGVFNFEMASGGQVTLDLFDVGGNKTARLWAGSLGAGPHSLSPLEAVPASLPSGTYFINFDFGGAKTAFKLIRQSGKDKVARLDGNSILPSNESGPLTERQSIGRSGLRKGAAAAAIIDTILIRKSGYVTKHVYVDRYLGTFTYPEIITDDLKKMVAGAWYGKKDCVLEGKAQTWDYGLSICPKGRVRGYEENDGVSTLGKLSFLICDSWTMTGDVFRATGYTRDVLIGDTWPNHSLVIDYYYDYDVMIVRLGPCSVTLDRLIGEITEADCVSSACNDGAGYKPACGYDGDCGRCWYCDSDNHSCRYGGEGPYGCYRGWQP